MIIGHAEHRYLPDELIRYYDLNMAYEYLLNAAIDAIVTYWMAGQEFGYYFFKELYVAVKEV